MPQLLNGLALSNTQFLWKSFTGPVVKETKATLPHPPASQPPKIKAKKNQKPKNQSSGKPKQLGMGCVAVWSDGGGVNCVQNRQRWSPTAMLSLGCCSRGQRGLQGQVSAARGQWLIIRLLGSFS